MALWSVLSIPLGRWDRFDCILFHSLLPAHSHIELSVEKMKPKSTRSLAQAVKCVYFVPYDVSVVNFIAASKREKSELGNVRKVGDKSCWKSVFEQNETNFFGVFFVFFFL